MSWLRTVAHEVWGLFVDDGSFAVAILVWIGVMWLVVRQFGLTGWIAGAALFGGLGLILVVSLLHFARQAKKRVWIHSWRPGRARKGGA